MSDADRRRSFAVAAAWIEIAIGAVTTFGVMFYWIAASIYAGTLLPIGDVSASMWPYFLSCFLTGVAGGVLRWGISRQSYMLALLGTCVFALANLIWLIGIWIWFFHLIGCLPSTNLYHHCEVGTAILFFSAPLFVLSLCVIIPLYYWQIAYLQLQRREVPVYQSL